MPATPLPIDHATRMERARLALDGLSIGDGFGASIFDPSKPDSLRRPRPLPAPPWRYTDDTIMAMGIVEVLHRHGRIDQDELVSVFARRYWADVDRGYGPNIHRIFEAILRGAHWRTAATTPGDGQRFPGILASLRSWLGLQTQAVPDRNRGSLGNGAAMRVAPVGGYFADDLPAAIAAARDSAEVTHAHPDGIAGAVAVAVAAVWAWRCQAGLQRHSPQEFVDYVLDHTPVGPTRERLTRARPMSPDTSPDQAARELGNGNPITSAETVPFTIWCAARHMNDYAEALWTTACVGGDIDTNCAIVGGVVALGCGRERLPGEWLEAREPLTV